MSVGLCVTRKRNRKIQFTLTMKRFTLIIPEADDIKQFISHSIRTSVIRIGMSMENENIHMEKKR